MDILSVKEICANLKVDANIQIFDSLESTNTTLKELALLDKPHGTVIIANGLTGARGRRGRSFYAPKGAGIYMSIILRPDKNVANSPELITISAAVAVCRAIEKVCRKSPQIKWINDIFLDNRKICGILTEAVTDNTGELSAIILGIGINFVKVDVPDELQKIVGAVFSEGEQPTITRNQLIAEVLNQILKPYFIDRMPRTASHTSSWNKTLENYKELLFILGKEVRVESAEPYLAVAVDVDDRGRLIVQDGSGNLHTLDSGEISIRT